MKAKAIMLEGLQLKDDCSIRLSRRLCKRRPIIWYQNCTVNETIGLLHGGINLSGVNSLCHVTLNEPIKEQGFIRIAAYKI